MHILIVKLFPNANLFHALPTVHRLRRAYDAKVDWVVHEDGADLVACFDDVDRVIVYPEDELKHNNRRDFRRALHEQTYDLVVDLQGVMQSALVCKSARKQRGAQVLGPSFQTEGACFMYTAVAGIRDRERHPVEECMDVLRFLELPTQPVAYPLRFPMPFVGHALPDEYVVCGLEGARKRDRLEADRWVELIEGLGVPVVLAGGRSVEALGDEIEDALPEERVFNFVRRVNVAEQGGLVQAASGVITCNELTLQIAMALQAPCVALFDAAKRERSIPFEAGVRLFAGSGFDMKVVLQSFDELRKRREVAVGF